MLLDIEARTGKKPEALRNRPAIGEADFFYISCFYDLDTSRDLGDTHKPLTIKDIHAYIEILGGFTREEMYRFLKMIQNLDQTYLKFKLEKEA